MLVHKIIIVLNLIILFISCNNEKKQKIPLEQMNIDKSNNYKYIFKDIIEEERRKEAKEKKDSFHD